MAICNYKNYKNGEMAYNYRLMIKDFSIFAAIREKFYYERIK